MSEFPRVGLEGDFIRSPRWGLAVLPSSFQRLPIKKVVNKSPFFFQVSTIISKEYSNSSQTISMILMLGVVGLLSEVTGYLITRKY